MKKNSLIIVMIIACTSIYGQGISNNNSTVLINPYNASNGNFNQPNNFKTYNKTKNEFKLSVFDSDCSTDFWTINSNGDIQQWSLINNSIIGGDTILGGGGSGLAYCGGPDSVTFYSSLYPSTGINYYDSINGWQNIPTAVPVLNNGGYKNDQYYLGEGIGGVNVLYYFDGINLTTIDSLSSEFFSVFDIAVDTLGRAWVFKGNTSTSVNNLNVYNSTGLITTYNITFNSQGAYGSFFLNDTLYVGMSNQSVNPNSVTSIVISGSVAQLGTPISFSYDNYYDMASCQNNKYHTTSISELLNDDINVFPNPTTGVITLPTSLNVINVEIYNSNGQMITKLERKHEIDLSNLPNGMYFIIIHNQNGEYIKKIIKR